MQREPEKTSNSILKVIGRALLKRLEMPIPSYEKRIINNMENLYREIQPGDVLLVEGRSELSRIIQLLTKSSWSHAAIYIGDRLKDPVGERLKSKLNSVGYTDRQHLLIEADTGNGVIAIPLNSYENYNIRICRPFGITAQDLQAVVDDVIDNLGKQYDHENILDLALLLLPSFLNPFKKRTVQACLGGCSEYKVVCLGMIAQAFQKVGYPIVSSLLAESDDDNLLMNDPYGSKLIMRHYSQIVPRDFDLSPNFEIVKYNMIGLSGFNYKSIWAER